MSRPQRSQLLAKRPRSQRLRPGSGICGPNNRCSRLAIPPASSRDLGASGGEDGIAEPAVGRAVKTAIVYGKSVSLERRQLRRNFKERNHARLHIRAGAQDLSVASVLWTKRSDDRDMGTRSPSDQWPGCGELERATTARLSRTVNCLEQRHLAGSPVNVAPLIADQRRGSESLPSIRDRPFSFAGTRLASGHRWERQWPSSIPLDARIA